MQYVAVGTGSFVRNDENCNSPGSVRGAGEAKGHQELHMVQGFRIHTVIQWGPDLMIS
jgi:hypothetical protein